MLKQKKKPGFIGLLCLNRNSIILLCRNCLSPMLTEQEYCFRIWKWFPSQTHMFVCWEDPPPKKKTYPSMPYRHLLTLSQRSFFYFPDVSIRKDHDYSLHAESSWNQRCLMSSIQITAKLFLTRTSTFSNRWKEPKTIEFRWSLLLVSQVDLPSLWGTYHKT